MENRNSSTSSRPFSVNNPFRNATVDSSINQYKNDSQFQVWAKNQSRTNSFDMPQLNTRTSSQLSFPNIPEDEPQRNADQQGAFYSGLESFSSGSLSPPSRPLSSKNPFLDDVSSATDFRRSPPPVSRNKNHPTAKEEKEQLRQRYLEESDVSTVGNTRENTDLPPSYEEITSTNGSRRAYPKEKVSRPSSHREHSNSGTYIPRRSSSHHHREASSSSTPSKKGKRKSKVIVPKNVDTIDKLDVTGLFGGSFHHDGPFDAVTPHRNKNNKAAPVLAFPVDGPNSTIGGASTKKSALDEVFGRDDTDDSDIYQYSSQTLRRGGDTQDAIKANVGNVQQMDAKNKTELVHGPVTAGLGSSTFLDGAPASLAAIRNDIKAHSYHNRNGGLQRNKSLSQRLGLGGSGDSNAPMTGVRRNLSLSRDNYDVGHSNEGVRRSKTVNSSNRTHKSNYTTDFDGQDDHNEDEEDVYLGVRYNEPNMKKKSTGSKLLSRVKSLKVGRKSQ
ncbi:BDN_1c_G0011840.mRNA.1.CDS.1 [Saccharomyces cerevisiae]|nr:BDN_1c_G0011840.mRNA.1.CDS.1 [Saccharomyces cerevisiae]CAI7081547.1 BDN_1c_G0011840.mRNA.1.CDS.1 [Saccharomyces cerevisiae]